MASRLVVAFLIALLAHAGAYAIILMTSPQKKADIKIRGGSISISLLPTDSPISEDSDAFDESLPEPEADAAIEGAPAEPVPKQPLEPDPIPKPIPEPAEILPEPKPDIEPKPSRDAETLSESESPPSAETFDRDGQPTDVPPAKTETPQATNAEQGSGPASESSIAEKDAPGDQNASVEADNPEIGNAAQDNYNGALMRHMRKARKFDTNARRSSKLAITIDAQGHVLEIKVLRASGDKTWDRRVIKELKRIAPYPLPPSGVSHSWTFDAVPK